MARFSRLAVDPVVLLDERKHVAEQLPAERFDRLERGGIARRIPVGHHDQHRHGFVLRQEILLDLGSPCRAGPSLPRNRRRRAEDTEPGTCGPDTGRNRGERRSPRAEGFRLRSSGRSGIGRSHVARPAIGRSVAGCRGPRNSSRGWRRPAAHSGSLRRWRELRPRRICNGKRRFERTDGHRPEPARILLHRHAPHARLILNRVRGLRFQRPDACRNQYLGGLRRFDPERDPAIGSDPR